MLEQLLEGPPAGLLGVLELAAKLGGRTSDDDHFLLRSGERPLGITGRQVFAGKIGGLVASVAAHAVNTLAIFAALDVLRVDMAVIALQRRVTRRVTVLAAGRGEDFVDLQKCLARGLGIWFGGPGSGVN